MKWWEEPAPHLAATPEDAAHNERLSEDVERSADPSTDPPPSPEADEDYPAAVDVADLATATEGQDEPMVVKGLLRRREIFTVAGGEGEGKTLLVEQLARQTVRGEPALGMFPPGELALERVLIVDTEMELPEAQARAREAEQRGLAVARGSLHWLSVPTGLNLDTDEAHRALLRREVELTKAQLVVIDTVNNATSKPREDESAKAMFNFLSELMADFDLLGLGLSMQLRKRAQGEYGRSFDDLFGSREHKGRPSKVLYIDGGQIVAWKDRGGHLRRLWPARAGGRYPMATLLRPGLDDDASVPFEIEATEPEAPIDEDAVRAEAIAIVGAEPEVYTKNALARKLGVRMADAVRLVNELLASRTIGPDKARAKLRILNGDTLLEGP